MDSATPSETIETAPEKGADDVTRITPRDPDAPTERLPAASRRVDVGEEPLAGSADPPGTSALISTTRNQCAVCGCALAPDQRYCVECGERHGRARVPQLEGIAGRARPASASSSRGRGGGPVNNTLLAVIGTLLLALGVGVLIGRTSSSGSKTPAPQVVTVAAGSGVAGAAGTGAAQNTTAAAAAAAKAKAAAAKAAAAKAPSTHTKVPLKVVTVGSPGKGPGYQHGHFTGNFFGPESEEKK